MLKNPWHSIKQKWKNNGEISNALEIIEELSFFSPPIFPRELKEIYENSEKNFQFRGMREQELATRIIIAYLCLHTGEEKSAIKISKSTISESSGLPPELLAKAIYIICSGYSRIGNLDHAFKMVCETGIVVAHSSREKLPWMPSQMLWLKAQIMWKMYLYQNHPDLWCGPPIESGLNESRQTFPKSGEILAEIDQARRLLPSRYVWPFNDIVALALQGVASDQGAARVSAAALERIASLYADMNPAVTGWALLGSALLHLKSGMHEKSLLHASTASRIAQRFHLETLLRNALVYESRLREIQSDYPGALAAQKNLSVLHLRSVSAKATPLDGARLRSDENVPAAPLHLQNAIKYIESHLRKKIKIIEVANHCRVSRRTLEMSFKKYKKTTIFEYIKTKRMRLAADALLKESMPMHQLAQELGYSSQAVFSRDFSRHHGLSPRNWLRNQQQPANHRRIDT